MVATFRKPSLILWTEVIIPLSLLALDSYRLALLLPLPLAPSPLTPASSQILRHN